MLLAGAAEKGRCTTRTTNLRSFMLTVGRRGLVSEAFSIGWEVRGYMTSVKFQIMEGNTGWVA